MRKFITSILILLAVAVTAVFIIFVVNTGSNNIPSQQPVIKAKDLSVLRISPVGKSISEGVTSDNYAFKTKGDNVIELGIKGHSPVSSKQGIINSLIKIAKASDDVSSPYFKADKWDGESNFSLTFQDGGNFNVTLNNGTAVSEDSNYKFEFTPVDIKQGFNDEGGLDMSITLKKAPPNNQLSFSYYSQSVRAFLQPSLTKEWTTGQDLGDGRTVDTVTDTDVYDNKGNLVTHRPDYVINAIAFYGNPNQVNDTVGGKQYKTGEIGMLYRMKAIDSQGKSAWFDWSISGSTITLNDTTSFLQTASYPVTLQPAGDTFGYTSAGATFFSWASTFIFGAYPFPSTANAGIASNIQFNGNWQGSAANVQMAIYTDGATSNFVGSTATVSVNSGTKQWWSANITSGGSISANTTYDLLLSAQAQGFIIYYTSTSGYYNEYVAPGTFGTWPGSYTWDVRPNQTGHQFSIYVTYTPPPAVNFSGGINLSGGVCVGGSACPTVAPGFTCGSNVSFTYKGSGVTYGTVSHNGACWMDRNLGASEVATSYNDSNAYGDLFQWGRLDDGHQTRTSGTTTNLSGSDNPGNSNFIYGMGSPYDWRSPQGSGCGGNSCLWQGVSGVNNPCPSGWRIPTQAEWTTEYSSWSSQDYNGAFASPLKLTAGGYRFYYNASLNNVGSYGIYWSSTVNGANADYLNFLSGYAYMSSDNRAYGFSVRCVEN